MSDEKKSVYIVMGFPTDAFHSAWSTKDGAEAVVGKLGKSYAVREMPLDAVDAQWTGAVPA